MRQANQFPNVETKKTKLKLKKKTIFKREYLKNLCGHKSSNGNARNAFEAMHLVFDLHFNELIFTPKAQIKIQNAL